MNGLLRSMMAQMESWEAANEFGIPAVSWADYDARKRSDDLYVSCLAHIFDALRIADNKTRLTELDALAKTIETEYGWRATGCPLAPPTGGCLQYQQLDALMAELR